MDSTIKRLNELKDELCSHGEENMAINIIVDDSDVQNQIFIEIENDKGESIRIGEEFTTEEGYRRIRITTSDIIQHGSI